MCTAWFRDQTKTSRNDGVLAHLIFGTSLSLTVKACCHMEGRCDAANLFTSHSSHAPLAIFVTHIYLSCLWLNTILSQWNSKLAYFGLASLPGQSWPINYMTFVTRLLLHVENIHEHKATHMVYPLGTVSHLVPQYFMEISLLEHMLSTFMYANDDCY